MKDGELIEMKSEEFSLFSYRTFLPCYTDKNDPTSLHYVLVIRQGDESKLEAIKSKYPPINIPQEGDFDI